MFVLRRSNLPNCEYIKARKTKEDGRIFRLLASSTAYYKASNDLIESSIPRNVEQHSHRYHPVQDRQDNKYFSLASTLNVDTAKRRYFDNNFFQRPSVVGHRGSPYIQPENTRASFLTSAEIGCDAIELDVFRLKCGTLVVFHGTGTDDNAGLVHEYCYNLPPSLITEYTAEEVRSFVFNQNSSAYGCDKSKVIDQSTAYIPTLKEVLLDAKRTGVDVKIELKQTGTAESVLNLVESLSMVSQCHFSSFKLGEIQMIRKLRPQKSPIDGEYVYKTGCLFDEPPSNFIEIARSVGASEIHLKYDTCTVERVNDIHNAGFRSMCWFRGPVGMKEDSSLKYFGDCGNEDEEMYDLVIRTGVQSMCVNRPDVLVGMLLQLPSVLKTKKYAL